MARIAVTNRVASTRSGNILYNGDFEAQPAVITAATNTATRWIDGTAAGSTATKGLGWGTVVIGAGTSEAGFDTSNAHSGTAAMRISTTTTGATGATIGTFKAATPAIPFVFPMLPSTSYTLTGWIKTNNVATNSAFIDLRQLNTAMSALATTSSTKFTGTNAYTQVTITVTTNASTAYGTVFLRNNVAGNVGDAWFDDITLVPATIGRVAESGRVAA